MGSPSLFTRQQALKLGYFYWLRVKNSNPLLRELSRCYLKHTKFYLEHKASFIQISSITSFNSFLIACCGDITLFRTVPSSNMFFIRLFLANTWEKKSGVTVLVSSQTAVKGGHGFEIAVRMDNLSGGDWGEIQNKAHRVRSMHSRSSSFSVVFMCLISATQKFKLEKNTLKI